VGSTEGNVAIQAGNAYLAGRELQALAAATTALAAKNTAELRSSSSMSASLGANLRIYAICV